MSYDFDLNRSSRTGRTDQGPPMAVTGADLAGAFYGYDAPAGAAKRGGGMRAAGDRLLGAVRGAATPRNIGGVGTILALLAAAGELGNPDGTAGGNITRAVGSGGGALAGGAGGALLGQALIPIPGVGALVGATLGGALGSPAGRELGNLAAGLFEGSPEQRALQQAKKMADAQLEIDTERLRTLMPIQDAAAQMAIANEVKRAEAMSGLMDEQRLRDTMAAALLQQSQAAGVQQQGLTQAILGGLV